MYPNLSQLPLPTGTYPDSPLRWEERKELVLGGCTRFTDNPDGRKCYEDWSAAFLARVRENPQADTILMLCVGAGVLELPTLRTALREAPHIKHLWLIDPGVTYAQSRQVLAAYRDAFEEREDVQMRYYVGNSAVVDASASLWHTSRDRVVAVIGALNQSFGLCSAYNVDQTLREPMHLVSDAEMRNPNVHVVRASEGANGYRVLDETVEEFRRTQVRDHANALRWEKQRKDQEEREDDRPVDQPPACLIN